MDSFDYVTAVMVAGMVIIFCLAMWELYRSLSGREKKEYEENLPRSRHTYDHQEALSLLWKDIMAECEDDELGSLERYECDVGLAMIVLRDGWSDQIKIDALNTFLQHLSKIGKYELYGACIAHVTRYGLGKLIDCD